MTIGIDAIISVVGSLALATQIGYIDAAVEAGVKRFIPSEFGCDTQAPYLFHPKRVTNNKARGNDFRAKTGRCCISQRIIGSQQNNIYSHFDRYVTI